MTGRVEQLSEREKDVLRLLVTGHDAKSIARELNVFVNIVNERLRASRRKPGVSSSREAARLLAGLEQEAPKKLVNDIPVIAAGGEAGKASGRQGGGLKHQAALAIGGALVMSLIVAVLMLAWAQPEQVVPIRRGEWRMASITPDGRAVPTNVVRLDGNHLSFNGSEISEATLRQFLDITTQMSPQPVLVLSPSAQTKPKRVEAIRVLIEDVVQCTPANCVEVVSTSK